MKEKIAGRFSGRTWRYLKISLLIIGLVSVFLVYWKIKYPRFGIYIVRDKTQVGGVEKTEYQGEVARVDDPYGYYSVEVPKDWKNQQLQLTSDLISNFGLVDPDMLVDKREIADGIYDVYYRNGGFVTVSVYSGESQSSYWPTLDATKYYGDVLIGGESGYEFNYRDDIIKEGELWEARAMHLGDSYVIRFGYDPDGYPEGESVYRKILASFEFKEE